MARKVGRRLLDPAYMCEKTCCIIAPYPMLHNKKQLVGVAKAYQTHTKTDCFQTLKWIRYPFWQLVMKLWRTAKDAKEKAVKNIKIKRMKRLREDANMFVIFTQKQKKAGHRNLHLHYMKVWRHRNLGRVPALLSAVRVNNFTCVCTVNFQP